MRENWRYWARQSANELFDVCIIFNGIKYHKRKDFQSEILKRIENIRKDNKEFRSYPCVFNDGIFNVLLTKEGYVRIPFDKKESDDILEMEFLQNE